MCPLGQLLDVQEVFVAVSGHDSVPRGTAQLSDPGSGQEARPARDWGLLGGFLHVLTFCKETPCFLRALNSELCPRAR